MVGIARRRHRARRDLRRHGSQGDQGRNRPAPRSRPDQRAAWRRDSTWRLRGQRRLQHDVVVYAQIAADQPPVTDGGRTPQESEDYVTTRWWHLREITRSRERFYPGRLRELLPRFLAGETIDEPFEHWN
jgi:hypothetical protein